MTDSSGKCTVEKTTRENELNFSVFSLTKTDYETSNTHNDPDDDFVGNDPSVTIVKGSSSVGSIGGGSDGGTDDGSGPSCPPGKAAKNKC